MSRGVTALIALSLMAGCPKQGPKPEQVERKPAKPQPCDGIDGAEVAATEDAANDLYELYRGTGAVARLEQAWPTGGAGGVHALLTGYVQREVGRCALLAAVVERDGARVVVPLARHSDRDAYAFAGAYDMAGCRTRELGEAALDEVTTIQLAHMRQPAIAFQIGERYRFYHLGGGRVTEVGELRPSYETDNGSISLINSIELKVDEDGLTATWQDVYHPNEYDGPPSSPVAKEQSQLLALPDHARSTATPAPAADATRARVAEQLGVAPADIAALTAAPRGLLERHGYLFIRFDRAGSRRLAVGQFVALGCGAGLAVDSVVELGADAEPVWAGLLRFDKPMKLARDDKFRSVPLVPVGELEEPRIGRRSMDPKERERLLAVHRGLAVITRGADGGESLHLLSERRGLVGQIPGPLPKEIELARGADEMPVVLVGSRIYRFADGRYQVQASAE